MKLIYIASPYRGDILANTAYAKTAMKDAIKSGVAPIAPHLLYPQVLDDTNAEQRNQGIALALEMLKVCDELWVYGNHISEGMQVEIDVAEALGIQICHKKGIPKP